MCSNARSVLAPPPEECDFWREDRLAPGDRSGRRSLKRRGRDLTWRESWDWSPVLDMMLHGNVLWLYTISTSDTTWVKVQLFVILYYEYYTVRGCFIDGLSARRTREPGGTCQLRYECLVLNESYGRMFSDLLGRFQHACAERSTCQSELCLHMCSSQMQCLPNPFDKSHRTDDFTLSAFDPLLSRARPLNASWLAMK